MQCHCMCVCMYVGLMHKGCEYIALLVLILEHSLNAIVQLLWCVNGLGPWYIWWHVILYG